MFALYCHAGINSFQNIKSYSESIIGGILPFEASYHQTQQLLFIEILSKYCLRV